MVIIAGASAAQSIKPRTIDTTDGEVDDQDSFIRLLLYANKFNLVGLGALLLDDSTEPIYLQIWGGTNTTIEGLQNSLARPAIRLRH